MNSIYYKDRNILFLILNVSLVIIGYGLAVITQKQSNAVVLPFKSFVLALSILNLFYTKRININIKKRDHFICVFFILALLALTLFSFDIFQTLQRLFTFIIPFFYVFFIIEYLVETLGLIETKNFLLKIFNLTYIMPILSYFLFGGSLDESNIYGDVVGAFVSNHYGWASIVYLLTFHDLWINNILNNKYKFFGILLVFPAAYLLIISGNRASYLCALLAVIVVIFFNKKIHLFIKILVPVIMYFGLTTMLENQNSSISIRLSKTVLQLENPEEYKDTRTTARLAGYYLFDKDPGLSLTGIGMFNFKDAMQYYAPEVPYFQYESGVHNSYLELLFGAGIIMFFYFIYFYIFIPFKNYYKFLVNSHLFIIPLLLLPYFESNLTGGQFLFYPWFLTLFLLRKYSNYSNTNIN